MPDAQVPSPSGSSPPTQPDATPPDPGPASSPTEASDSVLGRARKFQVQLLAYLAAATATVYGLWKLLGQKDTGFGTSDWQFWVALAIAVIPALATLVVFGLPRWSDWRRRRRLVDWSVGAHASGSAYFRLGPRGEEDSATFTRDDGAHVRALDWVRRRPEKMLYFVGVSGSGKSSVLAAHVIPSLRTDTLVVPLRVTENPLGRLRQALLADDTVWKSAQVDKHAKEDLPTLLTAATEHLERSGRRLLLVLDQFEELLVLDSADLGPLKDLLDFLRAVADGKYAGCRAVMSLRIEFIDGLTRVGLPPFTDLNHFTVDVFEDAAGRRFLSGGFDRLGPKLLDRVLSEAIALDNLVGRVRPITLNMVGLMLRRMPADTSRLTVGPRPFANHVRRMLEENDIRGVAPGVLRALLDERNQRLHKTVAELARDGGDVHVVNGCLERLALPDRGLVRCLNRHEQDVTLRRWEVSHDFVAGVLGAVLPGLRAGVWARARPWFAPAAVVLWAATFFLALPYEQRRESERKRNAAIVRLNTEFGIRVVRTEADGSLAVRLDRDQELTSLSEAVPLLNSIGSVTSLDAGNHEHLNTVDWCSGLTALKTLNLSWCQKLTSVDGLQGLTALQTLDLSGCDGLTSVEPLRGLTALKTLNLYSCKKLTSVEPLRGLTTLQLLDLNHCSALASVEPLRGLTALQTLFISSCRKLASVEPLRELTALQTLDLSECEGLTSVEPLRGLTALKTLNLYSCKKLTSVEGLQGLPALQTLNLAWCGALTSVEPLRGLTALQTLNLAVCDGLTSVEGLKGLPALQTLDLTRCENLKSVQGLQGLTALTTLKLSQCHSLTSFKGLQGVTALQTLDLSVCKTLTSVEGLQGLTALRTLNLSSCPKLASVEPLRGLTALQTLDLSVCDGLTSVEGLQGLSALQTLDLEVCRNLASVEPLRGLTTVQTLDLSGCISLTSVEGLQGMTALKSLDLSSCKKLTSVEPLRGLTALNSLYLSQCVSLDPKEVAGLRTSLKHTRIQQDR
jgi:Leucine-rich repeat (LRR) protein